MEYYSGDPEDLRGNSTYASVWHTDGLDVYVTDPVSNNPPWAYGIPNTYCNMPGMIDGDLSVETPALPHEVGHCLGLVHTFSDETDGSCDETEMTCPNSNDPCWCCGDYVCDTPISPSGISVNSACTASTDPTGLTEAAFKNIMSYANPIACRTLFTPQQGARMRAYLGFGTSTGLDAILVNTVVQSPGGSTTWSTPQAPLSNVLVPAGQTLYVQAEVEMPPGSYIYVERGAWLVVTATITGACDALWQGVIVAGREDEPQTAQEQGRVSIGSTGLIENAVCGVQAQGLDETGKPDEDGGGGIVNVGGGALRNNITGIRFAEYSYTDDGVSFPVASRILYGDFLTDDDYLGGDEQPTYLHLDGVYGLRVYGSDFHDDRTEGCDDRTDRAKGIYAVDAGFRVEAGSSFVGLDEAIHVEKSDESAGSFAVFNSTFRDCYTAIYATQSDLFVLDGNTFLLNRPDPCDDPENPPLVLGVQLNAYCAGFTPARNHFEANVSNSLGTETLVGTDCFALGPDNNEIFDNTFYAMGQGNRATGQNGLVKAGGMIYSGLQYLCNELEVSEEHDMHVTVGTVRRVQGEEIDEENQIAAGNIFTSVVSCNFYNQGSTTVTYYYGSGTGEDPECIDYPNTSGILDLEATQDNSACNPANPPECPFPPCPEPLVEDWTEAFYQHQNTWNEKSAAFPEITDFQEQQETAAEINRARLEMDRYGHQILINYALDTVSLRIDSILVWLARLQTYPADYHVVRHHFFRGNLTEADAIWADLPEKYELSGDELAVHEALDSVFNTIRTHLEEEGRVDELPEAILDALESWAYDCRESGYLARSLLWRNGRRFSPECLPAEEESRPLETRPLTERPTLRLYPNPVSEQLTLEFPNGLIETIGICDAQGKTIRQVNLTAAAPVASLPVSGLPPGLYVLRVGTTSGQVAWAKFVIGQ